MLSLFLEHNLLSISQAVHSVILSGNLKMSSSNWCRRSPLPLTLICLSSHPRPLPCLRNRAKKRKPKGGGVNPLLRGGDGQFDARDSLSREVVVSSIDSFVPLERLEGVWLSVYQKSLLDVPCPSDADMAHACAIADGFILSRYGTGDADWSRRMRRASRRVVLIHIMEHLHDNGDV